MRGRKLRHRVRRLLLPRARQLRRRRRRPLRTWRAAFARTDGRSHPNRPEAFRFHHRRRTVQAGMVRHRSQTLRLRRHRNLARLAGANRFSGATPDQALHQADAMGVAAGFSGPVHDWHRYRFRFRRDHTLTRQPLHGRRRRNRPSPASWATWICCGRWSWPTFPAPSLRGRAFLRSTPATRNLVWSGMIVEKQPGSGRSIGPFRYGAARTPGSFLRGGRSGSSGLAASRALGPSIPLRHRRHAARRRFGRQRPFSATRGALTGSQYRQAVVSSLRSLILPISALRSR